MRIKGPSNRIIQFFYLPFFVPLVFFMGMLWLVRPRNKPSGTCCLVASWVIRTDFHNSGGDQNK
jgi:hypothetical protein